MPPNRAFEAPAGVPSVESLATAPVPPPTPPVLPGSRPLPVIIGPVLSLAPPGWTPAVESGVPPGVVIEGPVAPPACGEALGFEPPAWATPFQASKSACVVSTADANAATAYILPATTATVSNLFIDTSRAVAHQGACRRVPVTS